MSSDRPELNLSMDTQTAEGPPPHKSKAAGGTRPRRKHQRKRGHGPTRNAAARHEDAHRLVKGRELLADYRASQNQMWQGKLNSMSNELNNLFRYPPGLQPANPIPVAVPMPCTTIGIGALVNNAYSLLDDAIRNRFSIYQLYRMTLAQFDYQRHLALENQPEYFESQLYNVHLSGQYKSVLKGCPDNLLILVYVIETYGHIKCQDVDFVCIIDPQMQADHNKYAITFDKLEEYVNYLATNETDWTVNPLPGAVIRFTDREQNLGYLANPQDYWPQGYSAEQLLADCNAFKATFQALKTSYSQLLGKLSYTGFGRSSALISTRSMNKIQLPFVEYVEPAAPPTTSAGKKRRVEGRATDGETRSALFVEHQKIRPLCTDRCIWFSPNRSIVGDDFALGQLALYGATSNELETRYSPFRARAPNIAVLYDTGSWSTLFNQAMPRVSRPIHMG